MTEREIQVRIAERNDQGSTADANRDALGHASLFAGNLLVLASGVGGTGAGRVEANLAVSTILTQFRQTQDAAIPHRLAAALSHGNDVLRTRATSDRTLFGSGASVAAALVRDNQFWAARAGNVRVLIVRGERAIDAVGLDDAASDHETPAATAGALGAGQHARIVVSRDPIRLIPGDRVVLAAPGLHEHVDTVQIGRMVSTLSAQDAVSTLVDTAQRAGAAAGISVQLLQYGDAVPAELAVSIPTTGGRTASVGEGARPAVAQRASGIAPIAASSAAREASPVAARTPTPPPSEPQWADDGAAKQPAALRRPERPRAASALEPTAPDRREPSLGDTPPPRLGREPLPQLGSDARRNTVLAFGIAVVALLVLLVWRPWAGGKDAPPDDSTTAAAGEASSLLPPVEGSSDPTEAAAEGEGEGEGEGEAPPLEMEEVVEEPGLEAAPAAVEAGPFWSHMDTALDAGDRIDQARVRSWLAADGADVPVAAAARRAQLRVLDAALASLIPPDPASGIEAEDQAALDRVFAAPSADAADKLKGWIEREHGKRGDAVFDVASAWLRANRTPKSFEVLVQLMQRKLGPKTKAWITDTAPRDLMND